MSRIEDALNKMKAERAAAPAPVSQTAASQTPALVANAGSMRIDDRIAAFHRPGTAFTENLKHTVIRAVARGSAATLGFTSAEKGEGKSIVALNFAVAFAYDCEGTVCVVDGDLRNPTIHKLVGVSNGTGFSEMLDGSAPADGTHALPTPLERLFILTAGKIPTNPSELLGSKRAAQVIAELRSRFDYLIFDTAPVLPAADTIHLASHLEGVVVVVEAGRTKRKQVARAVDLLSGANILGFILNKIERDKSIKDYQ
ncbi:MAG TPA: CpsD/CapB family tyrosine-protein kinase [Planctomycetota bacterium]|nr:CpsD/CapB family tyrosine-protein kinase [Planctomycetota bacterium]